MNKDSVVILRVDAVTAAALKAEKARTGCSTSEFIRRAVTDALNPVQKVETP